MTLNYYEKMKKVDETIPHDCTVENKVNEIIYEGNYSLGGENYHI